MVDVHTCRNQTVDAGNQLRQLCAAMGMCVEETLGILRGTTDPDADFVAVRNNIVDHLQGIVDSFGGFHDKAVQFDSAFGTLFGLVTTTGNYGEVKPEGLAKLTGKVMALPVGATMEMLIPYVIIARIQDGLKEDAGGILYAPDNLGSLEEIGALRTGAEVLDPSFVLGNTICTLNIFGDEQEQYQTIVHMVAALNHTIEDKFRSALFEMITFLQSAPLEKARMDLETQIMEQRNDGHADPTILEKSQKALNETLDECWKTLTQLKNILYVVLSYTKVFVDVANHIPNTSLLIDAAWAEYQKLGAATF